MNESLLYQVPRGVNNGWELAVNYTELSYSFSLQFAPDFLFKVYQSFIKQS